MAQARNGRPFMPTCGQVFAGRGVVVGAPDAGSVDYMSAALLGCLVAVIVALPSSALWAVPLTVGQRRAGRLCAMAVSFECTTESVLAPERLFDLARDITAHTDSMSRSRETAVGGVRSGLIGLDEEVTWRAWHFGLPLRMTSRITAMRNLSRWMRPV